MNNIHRLFNYTIVQNNITEIYTGFYSITAYYGNSERIYKYFISDKIQCLGFVKNYSYDCFNVQKYYEDL